MSEAGKHLRKVGKADGYTAIGYAHWCQACREMHVFAVEEAFSNGAKWTFNGNFDKPSFSPSMNIRTRPRPTVPVGRPDAGQIDICHYFLKDGMIQYLGDCTHSLKGQTIALQELPEHLS